MSNAIWRFDDDTYEFIKGEIIHIFVSFNVKCVPVSGFEIASKMGIPVIPYSSLSPEKRELALSVDPDGFVAGLGKRERIYFNDIVRSYKRQNMTILHELGHIVLDHRGLEEDRQREEDEADFFAKYAIAPPVLVDKIKAQSQEDIYNSFDITFEAAGYAFEYYQTWKRHYEKVHCYTYYEVILLEHYVRSQNANQGGLAI